MTIVIPGIFEILVTTFSRQYEILLRGEDNRDEWVWELLLIICILMFDFSYVKIHMYFFKIVFWVDYRHTWFTQLRALQSRLQSPSKQKRMSGSNWKDDLTQSSQEDTSIFPAKSAEDQSSITTINSSDNSSTPWRWGIAYIHTYMHPFLMCW